MRDQGEPPAPARRQREPPTGAGTRIVVLVLLAFLPLLGLHAYSILQISDAQEVHLLHDIEDLADGVSLGVAGTVETARSTVLALSEAAAFKAQEPAAASEILASVLGQHPEFINLWAARADGQVYATALPAAEGPPGTIAGRSYFQQVLATGKPVVQAVRGIPQRPEVFAPVVAVPVRQDRQVSGTLQVGFRLIGLQRLAVHIGLPRDNVVTVVSGQGTIISRSLQPQRFEGVSVANTAEWQAIKGIQEGTFEGPDFDGVERVT